MRYVFLIFVVVFNFYIVNCQQYKSYKSPSAPLLNCFNEAITGNAQVSPDGEILLISNTCYFAMASRLDAHTISLAGELIDTSNYSISHQLYDTSLVFYKIDKKAEIKIEGMPLHLKISYLKWAPDGKRIAFCNITPNETELWICNMDQRKAKKVNSKGLNCLFKPEPFIWMSDSKHLITYYLNYGNNFSDFTNSPIIYDNKNTWGDISENALLIHSVYDEKEFARLANAQLVKIEIDGLEEEIGQSGLLKRGLPSPDGQFYLIELFGEPFSYTAPYQAFPLKTEVWDQHGALFRELFELPSSESRAFGPGSSVKIPHNLSWQPFEPSTLYWIKASDGGNPRKIASVRDQLYIFQMPFDGDPSPAVDFDLRFDGLYWGTNHTCIAKEFWKPTGEVKLLKIDLLSGQKQNITSYNIYGNDSLQIDFICTSDYARNKILIESGKTSDLWALGKQVNEIGEYTYIAEYSADLSKSQVLWKAIEPYCEEYIGITNAGKSEIVTQRQSMTDFPNYFTRNLRTGVVEQITNSLQVLDLKQKPYTRLVTFPVNDSLNVNGFLSLPPGYKVGTTELPVLIWIYPQLKQANVNPVFSNHLNKFMHFQTDENSFYALNNLAVLSIPDLPIVIGQQGNINPTIENQLKELGEAIFHYLDSLPYTDNTKLCIGGEGLGASMAAWLVQNFAQFTYGIGIAGIYNTQSPLWRTQEQFNVLSLPQIPYQKSAEKPDETSFLIIDGELSRTAYESQQFYTGLKQHGSNARLVIFPGETMDQLTAEAKLHQMWEIENWLINRNKKK